MGTKKEDKKEDQAVEDIALILLKFEDEETFEAVAHRATDMARRAFRGWWELPLRPAYNKLMARMRKKLPKAKRDKKEA
jgi:hypothetical protein